MIGWVMIDYNIIKISPEITIMKDHDVCIYIVEGEKSAVVIDTGYGGNNLKEAVMKITLKPLIVICTHGHTDHAFGAHYFDKVYMHKDEVKLYKEHKKLGDMHIEQIAKEYGMTPEENDLWRNSLPDKIEYVSYGQTFDIGGNVLEVISLRGHTPGSIGLIDRKHRILFSSDGINKHLWMQIKEATTLAEYLETVKALKPFCKDFDKIYMGHSTEYAPVSLVDKVQSVVEDLLAGCTGKPYNNRMEPGMIYGRDGCEVVYNPGRIW
jgi:glyoxylase-like metal-dependent hydrolase (beta-lactamase superfamily II)